MRDFRWQAAANRTRELLAREDVWQPLRRTWPAHPATTGMLLRLHSMANTVINGADATAAEEALPELAQDLIMDLDDAIVRLRAWVKLIEPLEALAARD